MPIPPNTTSGTAIVISSLPYTNAQQVDDSGTTYDVWYKWTATYTGVVGFFAFGDLTTYRPWTTVFSPDAVTGPYLGMDVQNRPLQFPVTSGVTYYFSIYVSGNPAPANLSVSVQAAPTFSAADGDIMIPDDESGFSGIVIKQTDGSVVRFVTPFPAGDRGDSVPSGRILVEDFDFPSILRLYDFTFTLIDSIAFAHSTAGATFRIRACLAANSFYVGDTGNGATAGRAHRISDAGVVGSMIGPFATAGLHALAANTDETILYYVESFGTNKPIKRWNLTSNTALSDLVAGVASYYTNEMLMLGDGTLIVQYFTFAPDNIIKRYSAGGTVLNTYSLGAIGQNGRLAYAGDDPLSFWFWTEPSAGLTQIRQVRVSDGTVLQTFELDEYDTGMYGRAETATPDRFGNSNSCPIFVLHIPEGGEEPPPDDDCECCVATKIDIINQALLKLGHSQTIASLGEASREAYTGNLLYDPALHETLRQFPWSFATKYLALTLRSGPAWDTDAPVLAWSSTETYAVNDVVSLGGTLYYAIAASLNQTPPNSTYWSTTAPENTNGDWLYAYYYPSDCLFGRRLVPEGLGRTFDPAPLPFRVGRTFTGTTDVLLVYSNQPEATLEYTALVECSQDFADALFEDALSWRLAGKMAPSLSRNGLKTKECWAMFLACIDTAAAVSSREHQPEPHGDAEWIRAR
jgi:hypothetical protein